MNRLIFSEGGQPVFLEDLKLLQDNMIDLIFSLFPVTDGGEETSGFDDAGYKDLRNLPIYSTPRHVNGSADANCEIVQAHKLITKNGVYDVPETIISEGEDEDGLYYLTGCYYVLNEEIIEKREFEDGVSRGVVKSLTAKIVGTKPTSGTFYAVKDVPSLDALQTLPVSYKDLIKR